MREMPSFYYTPVERSFFPFDGQGTPLGEGCEVHFGFYSRVRHSEWKAMLVNIDGKQDGDVDKLVYYMEKSVLLETKPLVDSIRHFIRDPSGVFSVCHLCECRIVQ